MQFSDNEIIALLFGTSLSEPRGMYVLLPLVPAVNQKRSATNSGDGKTLTNLKIRFFASDSCWPKRIGLMGSLRSSPIVGFCFQATSESRGKGEVVVPVGT
jgi:hypothetical protein